MSNLSNLADVALAANLTEAEALCAPAVLTSFCRSHGGQRAEGWMLRELHSNRELREYFAQVCRTVAASPEGQSLAADYAQAKGVA